MDPASLPFTPNFSAKHSALIDATLSAVWEKLGTAAAHTDVCKLSSLCTKIDIGEEDVVELGSEGKVEGLSFLKKEIAAAGDQADGKKARARRQNFSLEETVPVLFGAIKSKVNIRGTLTWVDPTPEALASSGPLYSVYESEVVGGLAIQIYRLREMRVVDEGGKQLTRITESLYGVGPGYLNWLIAKEAVEKHKCVSMGYFGCSVEVLMDVWQNARWKIP